LTVFSDFKKIFKLYSVKTKEEKVNGKGKAREDILMI